MPITDNYPITEYISHFVAAYNNYNKNNRDRHERKKGGVGGGRGAGGGDDTPLASNDFFEGNVGETSERRSGARNDGFSRALRYHLV